MHFFPSNVLYLLFVIVNFVTFMVSCFVSRGTGMQLSSSKCFGMLLHLNLKCLLFRKCCKKAVTMNSIDFHLLNIQATGLNECLP